MVYHLDLNLQQRATLSFAISIWNNQKVKDEIIKWSDTLQSLNFCKVKLDWQQLTKEVLKKVNQNVLPPQLQSELNHVIIEIGKKIMNWYTYIWYEYYNIYGKEGDIINYIEEVYWTPTGTIDEVKILQTFWLKNPKLDVAVMYNIACKNALKEDIDYLWQKIPCNIKDRYDKLDIHDRDILAYWKHCRDGLIDHYKNNAVSEHLCEDERERIAYYSQNWSRNIMFLISVSEGYSTAAKYFWKKLTQEEKDSSLLYSAYIAVDRSYSFWYRSDKIEGYLREKHVEILIFLINQMTMDQKESFLREESVPKKMNTFKILIRSVKRKFFSMLLSAWPWQEILLPTLDDMFQYLEHNTIPSVEVLLKISRKMVTSSYAEESKKYRSMFHQAWFIIPGSIKRTMIHQNNPNNYFAKDFMCNLLTVLDLDNIKVVFNDPEIADVRMQYIDLGRRRLQQLIKLNKYEFFNQFMEEVLRTEEEKIFLKSIIDHINVCNYFIYERQYDSADKFLNWKFETVKDRKQCKDHFKNEFSIDWIWNTLKLYKGCVEKAKEETFRFLKWMLESEDDIIRFMRDFITNSDPLIEHEFRGHFGICTLFEEEAQKIRQILA